jgi:hypothetical protein
LGADFGAGRHRRRCLGAGSAEERIFLTFDKDFGELAQSIHASADVRYRLAADTDAESS